MLILINYVQVIAVSLPSLFTHFTVMQNFHGHISIYGHFSQNQGTWFWKKRRFIYISVYKDIFTPGFYGLKEKLMLICR